jgi:hypothetical protein
LAKQKSDSYKQFYEELQNIIKIMIEKSNQTYLIPQLTHFFNRFFVELIVLKFLWERKIIKWNNNSSNDIDFLVKFLKVNNPIDLLNQIFDKLAICDSSCYSININSRETILLPSLGIRFFQRLNIIRKETILLLRSYADEISEFFNKYQWDINESISSLNTSIKRSKITPKILGYLIERNFNDKFELIKTSNDNEKEIIKTKKISKRKQQGIYFTPNKITTYISKELIQKFLSQKNENLHFMKSIDYEKLDQSSLKKLNERLSNITILDPACGSGDFLIAAAEKILKKHQYINKLLGKKINIFQEKIHITTTNLFGVDLSSEVISTVKRRFWLWLLADWIWDENQVDLNTELSKNKLQLTTKESYHSLPTLNNAFMVGNSLIGFYELNQLSEKRYSLSSVPIVFQSINQLYKSVMGQKIDSTYSEKLIEILNLKNNNNNNQIITEDYPFKWFFRLANNLTRFLNKNREKIPELRQNIITLISNLRSFCIDQLNEQFVNNINSKKNCDLITLSELKKLQPFHWVFNFYSIFEKDNPGFDIIIGNPPYIQNKNLKVGYEKELYKILFQSAFKLYDLSFLFIERGYQLLRKNGLLGFIITNKFTATDSGIKVRELLLQKNQILALLDVSSITVFREASIYPQILLFKKKIINYQNTNIQPTIRIATLEDLAELSNKTLNSTCISQQFFTRLPKKILTTSKKLPLIEKLLSIPRIKTLGSIGSFHYRLLGFTNWPELLKNVRKKQNNSSDLPFIGTTNIEQFAINLNNSLKVAKKTFNRCFFQYSEKFSDKWTIFQQPKIMIKEIDKELTAAYDPGLFANLTGIYSFIPNEIERIFEILLILNSKLLTLFFRELFNGIHLAGGYYRFNGSYLKTLPIITLKEQSEKELFGMLGKRLTLLEQMKRSTSINCLSEKKILNNIKYLRELSDNVIIEQYFRNDLETNFGITAAKYLEKIDINNWFQLAIEEEMKENSTVKRKGKLEQYSGEFLELINNENLQLKSDKKLQKEMEKVSNYCQANDLVP